MSTCLDEVPAGDVGNRHSGTGEDCSHGVFDRVVGTACQSDGLGDLSHPESIRRALSAGLSSCRTYVR